MFNYTLFAYAIIDGTKYECYKEFRAHYQLRPGDAVEIPNLETWRVKTVAWYLDTADAAYVELEQVDVCQQCVKWVREFFDSTTPNLPDAQ